MKGIFSIGLIMLLSIFAGCTSQPVPAHKSVSDNQLQNPHFEIIADTEQAYWWSGDNGMYAYTIPTSNGRALTFPNMTGVKTVAQMFDLEYQGFSLAKVDAGLYKLKFGAYQLNISKKGDEGNIVVVFIDKNHHPISVESVGSFNSYNKWTKRESIVPVPPKTRYILINFKVKKDSTAGKATYFDDAYAYVGTDFVVPKKAKDFPFIDPLKQKRLYPGHYPGMWVNDAAGAAVKQDGTVVTWGEKKMGGTKTVMLYFKPLNVAERLRNVKAIYSTKEAFAALKNDGTVVTWGSAYGGGDSSKVSNKLRNVKAIYSTKEAFAALKNDGTVVTWGEKGYGGDSSKISNKLRNVKEIYSTAKNFAALKNDGTVVIWGNQGGLRMHKNLGNVKTICSTSHDFAALKINGTVASWGSSTYGYYDLYSTGKLKHIKAIYSTENAFAALKNDGTVVTWGSPHISNLSLSKKLTDIKNIYSSSYSFVALKTNGTLVTWETTYLSADEKAKLISAPKKLHDVKTIYSTKYAFAALRNDGTVVTWGEKGDGGDSSAITKQLTNVKAIYSLPFAFAALKNDGTVVTWGNAYSGGDSSKVSNKLRNVKAISAVSNFMAFKQDGSVIVWGNPDEDYSLLSTELTNVKSMSLPF